MEDVPEERAVVLTGRTVKLIGEFDLSSLPVLRRWLPARSSASRVVDLSECAFLDCTVLSLFVERADAAGEDPGRFCVTGATDQVARLFSLTGVAARPWVRGGRSRRALVRH